MRLLFQELQSRLHYKIILPFLLLTLCVALAGSAIAFRLVAGSMQERFDNQLAQVTRSAHDALVEQERANLQFLREVTTAPRNEAASAPAIAEAVASGDKVGLLAALDPYFRVGQSRASVQFDRLIVFDKNGLTLADLDKNPNGTNGDYTSGPQRDLSQVWFVPKVLASLEDNLGDKYAGVFDYREAEQANYYFFTVAPVRQNNQVVGGALVMMRMEHLLQRLATQSQANVVTFYDTDGKALVASTHPAEGIASLQIDGPTLDGLWASTDPKDQAVFSLGKVNGRGYQFAYTPLRIRSSTVGVLSAALAQDYVVGAWADARLPISALTIALMVMIIVLGVYIARMITRPLEELVQTARAVTSGDLARRSTVVAGDEIGVLSDSFNHMTEHLLQLYKAVSEESSQRAAIVESILDGIVVVDEQGQVKLVNRATRKFLGLGADDPPPQKLSDLPLERLTEGVPGFDARRSQDLYNLGSYILKVSIAPVITEEKQRLGYVCVLQDMTDEVAVDRAKNNFIGTISHELRTPLTVMRGTTDLLLRGLAGPLDDDQRTLIESMRQHTSNMTSLINNVIVIAGLDSGSLPTDLAPLELQRTIEEAIWPLRSPIKAKGLSLDIGIPEDMPLVLADLDQLRTIIHHLLDNARRYTQEGGITISAVCEPEFVRIDVRDTGRGIPADLQEQVFQRFVRGDGTSEGINSAERGIGLGLAIVKQLVERQGGRVWLVSAPGQGSTFSFTLQYADANPRPEKQERPFAVAA